MKQYVFLIVNFLIYMAFEIGFEPMATTMSKKREYRQIPLVKGFKIKGNSFYVLIMLPW